MTIELERPLSIVLRPATLHGVGRHRTQVEHTGFRLLHVCTGNICRSPYAEIRTRHPLVGRLGGRAAAGFLAARPRIGRAEGRGDRA